ncbi:sigma-54 interaction domain-containing protein [Calditrichota bacterium]
MQNVEENKKNNPTSNLPEFVKKFSDLKTVFDSLPDGIVAILDKDMNIATANKAISEMLQLQLDDILGRKATEFFKEKIPGLIEVLIETSENQKGVRNYTLEFMTPSGEMHSYLVSTAVIEESSNSDIGIVLILHDVSEMTRLRKIALQMDRYGEIIGKSESMKKIFTLIESIKHYDSAVLIVGETGTGKELIARAIHNSSNREKKHFIPVNCSALPDNLIESELFGHVKGAFTGATTARPGRFVRADEGTLFLDEVGTLTQDTQVKLLRVLQDKIIEPLGSPKRISVDVRIISATNRNLAELINNGEFREDLFYRLKVLQINLPALRERIEDIPLLINHFITRLNRYYHRNIVGVSPRAKESLMNYLWPGNVRELENAIEHAFIFSKGALLETMDFPAEIRHADQNGAPPLPTGVDPSAEEEKIKRTMLAVKGDREMAADVLGIHRSTLWRKMKEFRIDKNFGKPN